jgi:hypothetical protein
MKLRLQIDFNKARIEYMKSIWEAEMKVFKKGLKKNELKKLASIDTKLVDKLLVLYLQRCKFKHTIVFMQYRKHLPEAKLHDLIDVFKNRKEYFLKMVYKAENLVNKRKSLKTGIVAEEVRDN